RLPPQHSHPGEPPHSREPMPPLPAPQDSASVAFNKAYTLSLSPTYGINSVYVGGDLNYSGFNGDRPNYGKHVVFKDSEVRRPTDLLVFADCRTVNVASMAMQGLHFLT